MKINLKKTDIQINEPVEQLYLKKIQKIGKYFKKEPEIVTDFEIGRLTAHHEHGDIYFAKAHITIPGSDFYAEDSNESIDQAFNEMISKLTTEVRRFKEKKMIERRKGSKIRRLLKGFGRQ